ncbi:MAG TPA: hypothetical protein DIC19_02570 [Erysipelotrichaceae bacterium]|nr:hypothetical protein [Erysipelotrichaceae bacterium]
MYRIYNSFKLNSNQRFLNALLYGIPTALGLGIAYGYISRILPITFSIVYVGIGYLIGMVIQKFGRGVQVKFSILGAVLAGVAFVLSDVVRYFGLSLNPIILYQAVLIITQVYLGSINGLINLLFFAWGIVTAYNKSRII